MTQAAQDITNQDQDLKALGQLSRERGMTLLIQRYRRPIYYHALSITRDSDTAMDVAQEVFIRAHRCQQIFDDEFRVRPWLFRVTTNLCFNLVRDRKRRASLLETFHKSHERPAEATGLDRVHAQERSESLLRAMDSLSEDHRSVLMLKYWHELSYLEIADTLGVRIGTVMSRLSRARLRLGEIIEDSQHLSPEVLL